MKIQFLDTNQTITGVAGTVVQVPGFQVIHYNKPCYVKINILDDEPLNSHVELASAVVYNLPGAALILPILDNNIIDLSVISSYLPTFQKDMESGGAGRTVQFNFTVNPNGGLKYYYFNAYVMNIDSPNVVNAKAEGGTDFKNNEGVRVPVAHAFTDQVWLSPREATTDFAYLLNGPDGNYEYTGKQGIVSEEPIHGAYDRLRVSKGATLLLDKYYAPLVPSDCSITFRWLNTVGSMDYISCQNWTVTPTIRRDSLGGTVTKNEIQAIFAVNNDNIDALTRLSVSPDIQVKGILPNGTAIRVIGSTTSGVKMTASGLAKTITLKFIY
ncbi:hypothetical protein BT528P2_00012 [Bacteroides phage BT528P2]|nr:hypothetical protein BT498P1_00040 [Bacteroides phage BT498P1]WAX09303.1 hypothetical protein BT528P1_00012 [Bacteroides phage BT528P1]WAX09349.1 hypothetical protein BT528P2_00012 [Bacteroides phage BT528P2]